MGKQNWLGAIFGLAGGAAMTGAPVFFPGLGGWLFYSGLAVCLLVVLISVVPSIYRLMKPKPVEPASVGRGALPKKFTLFKLADNSSIEQATATKVVVREFDEVEGVSLGKKAKAGIVSIDDIDVQASSADDTSESQAC